MTKCFLLRPDVAWQNKDRYDIQANHKWRLPGVICPDCHATWATTGCEYPAIDLSSLPNVIEYEKPRAEPLDEFNRLRDAVKSLVPSGWPIKPGTLFGPLSGTGKGLIPDLAWRHSWSLISNSRSLDALRASGLAMPEFVRVQLTGRFDPTDLIEFQIPPTVHLADSELTRSKTECGSCGRAEFPDKPKLVIRVSAGLVGREPPLSAVIQIGNASLSPDRPLARIFEWPTLIVATENFKLTAERLGMSGVSFEELRVLN